MKLRITRSTACCSDATVTACSASAVIRSDSAAEATARRNKVLQLTGLSLIPIVSW
jgi:hypothetical protein